MDDLDPAHLRDNPVHAQSPHHGPGGSGEGRTAQDAVSDLIGAAAQHGGPSSPVGGEQGGGKKDDPVAFRIAALEVFYGHPDPGVFSWMDASEAEQFAAMARVARFVEWLRAVFALHELTPCWSLHPGVVLELWALERLHHATHVETTEPSAPTAFYNQLAVVRARLRTEGEMSTCRTEHTPPIPEPVEAVERRRATYDVPERVSARWAWPGIDDAGLAVPDPGTARSSATFGGTYR